MAAGARCAAEPPAGALCWVAKAAGRPAYVIECVGEGAGRHALAVTLDARVVMDAALPGSGVPSEEAVSRACSPKGLGAGRLTHLVSVPPDLVRSLVLASERRGATLAAMACVDSLDPDALERPYEENFPKAVAPRLSDSWLRGTDAAFERACRPAGADVEEARARTEALGYARAVAAAIGERFAEGPARAMEHACGISDPTADEAFSWAFERAVRLERLGAEGIEAIRRELATIRPARQARRSSPGLRFLAAQVSKAGPEASVPARLAPEAAR